MTFPRSAPGPRLILGLQALVLLLGSLPAAHLAWGAIQGQLGANPVEALLKGSGDWARHFLILTLCITPLRTMLGQPWLIRLRRNLGLLSAFYALVHCLLWAGLDQEFELGLIAADVLKRPFITLGFLAIVLMLPLALTSNRWSIRRLGGKGWQNLHRAIYPLALLVVAHTLWGAKPAVWLNALIYGAILVALLAWRGQAWMARARTAGEPHLRHRMPPGGSAPLIFHPMKPGTPPLNRGGGD